MAGSVKEIDRGWKKIQRTMLKHRGVVATRVGVQGSEANKDHGGSTNILVMSVQEFGSPSRGIPERPVFRSVFDEKRKKYEREFAKLGRDMVAGKTTARAGLTMIGEDYRADMINKVRRGKMTPALKPATQRKRGESGPPLWDTGQMMGSITVVIEK